MAVVLAAVSCGRGARIDVQLADAPSSEVIVKLLDVNKFSVLDTVALGKDGEMSYRVDVRKGHPEFVYLFHGDRKIASLVLQAGDRVSVKGDTLGNHTLEGSEESALLAQVEKDHAHASARISALASRLGEEGIGETEAASLRRELGQEYVNYYRSRVKYVMENSRSLTSVQVLYQTLGENLPVFGQSTDAIHFSRVADSLETVCPDSRYVKALRKEAERRFGYMELQSRVNTAHEVGFPDIELPDVNAARIKLSDVDSKVILVHFWTASDAQQKMFNLDILKPVYERFADKGFEIYQVAIDVDKALWAKVMKEQNLPWINVCDGLGTASPYIATYNVSRLPVSYIISDGALVDAQVSDEASLSRLLTKLLK